MCTCPNYSVPSKATRPVRSRTRRHDMDIARRRSRPPVRTPNSDPRPGACCISRFPAQSRIPHRSGIAILGSATAARPRCTRPTDIPTPTGPAQATPRGRRVQRTTALHYGTRDVSPRRRRPRRLFDSGTHTNSPHETPRPRPARTRLYGRYPRRRPRGSATAARTSPQALPYCHAPTCTRAHHHPSPPPRTRLYGRFACRRPQRLFDRGMLTAQLFHASKLVIQSLDRL